MHDDDDGGVAQHGGQTPKNSLTETYRFGLPCTSIGHACYENKVSADQYNVTISRAQVYSSFSSSLTADQVLVFRLDRGLMTGFLVENKAGLI